MIITETQIRVRYGETDQMGFVYYGNYALYLEVARVEALRKLGVSYRDLEEIGTWMPVKEWSVKYFKPAVYDDLLSIRCVIPRLPTARIQFDYEIRNEANELLSTATTTLFFIDKDSRKPSRPPSKLMTALSKHF